MVYHKYMSYVLAGIIIFYALAFTAGGVLMFVLTRKGVAKENANPISDALSMVVSVAFLACLIAAFVG